MDDDFFRLTDHYATNETPIALPMLNQLLDANEHESFRKALYSYSDRCVRQHVRRLTELPFEVEEVPWYQSGRFVVDPRVRPASFLSYATADYYIQDAASLLPLAVLDPRPSEMVCDLCASPGGKASAIAERLGPNGFLLANESIRSRVDVLRYSLARTGNPCFAVSSYDPEDLANLVPRSFDAVLVDAPCSGQTLVGRNKRDGNAFSENQIEHCALRQQRILQSAIQLLKLGGRLVYSTCTFALEENESQIQWLQEQYPGAWEPIEPKGLEPWRSAIIDPKSIESKLDKTSPAPLVEDPDVEQPELDTYDDLLEHMELLDEPDDELTDNRATELATEPRGAEWPFETTEIAYDAIDVDQPCGSSGNLACRIFYRNLVDSRRHRLCTTESRRVGSLVHVDCGSLRTDEYNDQQQPSVFEMGVHLQGSDDDRSGDRSVSSSQHDNRAQRRELPPRRSSSQTESPSLRNTNATRFRAKISPKPVRKSSCR